LIDNFSALELRPDKGAMVENFVATELYSLGKGLKYWRTKNKAEVDFILDFGEGLVPVEVKAGLETNVPSSLLSFIDKYSPDGAFVINESLGRSRLVRKTKVNFVSYAGKFDIPIFTQ